MVVIKTKPFYDVLLFWTLNCTKSDKKVGDISRKDGNTLRFPKRYNFCFWQKN